FDDDSACSCAFYFCAHFVEEIREIDDLRFACCRFNYRHAVGQNGCHHDVICAEHCRTEFALHVDSCRAQFRCEYFDVATFDTHCCSQCFKTFQMQIDRTIANNTAAG